MTHPVPVRPKRRWILRVALLAVVTLIALAWAPGTRLLHVLGLFEPAVIDENFRTMDARFTARIVRAGAEAFPLKEAPADLPESYTWNGQEKSVAGFIDVVNTTGLLVLRDDTVLYEKYWRGNDKASRAIAWSVSKSFVSALFGIALAEGKIKSLDQTVADYVPSLKNSGYGPVKIKDVLQMSSGIRFNEDYGDFNSDINVMGRVFAVNLPLEGFINGLKNERPPGTYNHYVSMNTQVLGMILVAATGTSLAQYTQEKLWKPLGMQADATWLIDGAGMEAAFGGLNAVLRDYARFGRLYLHDGNWNGTQIVPADWVHASVTPDAPHLMPGKRPTSDSVFGYGYQWWVPEGGQGDFLAIGIYGQAIYVSPRTGIVIARTAAYRDYNKDGDAMELESVSFFRAIAEHLGNAR